MNDMINYLTTKNRLLVAILAFILPFSFAKAEVKEDGKATSHGWYVGIEGGMPFGFSTFSSFGHDKTHLGWAAGLYGGYRFNSIFSAELSAKYGEMNLSAQDCCVERNYWLGSDGVLYKAGVLGMDSWEYANLKSHVRMGRYGARVNVNLLGLFHKTANSRWNLAVSRIENAVGVSGITISDDGNLTLSAEQAQKLDEALAETSVGSKEEAEQAGQATQQATGVAKELATVKDELAKARKELDEKDEQIKNLQGSTSPKDGTNGNPADQQPALTARAIADSVKGI